MFCLGNVRSESYSSIVRWRGLVWLRYHRIRRVDRSGWLGRIRSSTYGIRIIQRRWIWGASVVSRRGCALLGCDWQRRAPSWIAWWIRWATVFVGGAPSACINDLGHWIRYLAVFQDAGVSCRSCTIGQCFLLDSSGLLPFGACYFYRSTSLERNDFTGFCSKQPAIRPSHL